MRRRVLVVLLAVVGSWTVLPASAGENTPVIRRTAHGIPHILAYDYRGLGYGAGYAYAEDNLCTLADVVVTLSAERSRWFGPDATTTDGQDNLTSDLVFQQLNQARTVQELLSRGPEAATRDLVRGYVAGYNRYLAEHGVAKLPDPTCRGAAWVRPITELDIWRRAYQVAVFKTTTELAPLIAAAGPPGVGTNQPMKYPNKNVGSNAWALGRDATAGRTGMVLANPHSDWTPSQRFYQQQLTIPGELDVSGASLPGMPMILAGHTDRLAFAETQSTAETFTLTQLTLVPGDPTSYLVDGRARRMTRQAVTVQVREPDGSLAPVTRTMYRTPDGPLLALDWSATTAYVLHDANAGNLRFFDQALAVNRAHSVTELRAALARHQGAPFYNTVAADTTGTAYFGDVQVVPHVTDALLARCGRRPELAPRVVLDGSRSDCRWGSDPDAVEPGLFGPRRLPSLTRTDYVANSNDSPWLTNPAAPLTGYPKILGDTGTPRSLRTRLGLDMIASEKGGFTLPTLQATMFGNRSLSGELGRDAVVAMCRTNPTLTSSDGQPVDVRAACAALAGWDLRGDPDSRGGVLWRAVFGQAQQTTEHLWLVPFDPTRPATTPRGLDAGQPGVRQALADSVLAFQSRHIPLDVPIKDVQRYLGIPIHGCSQPEGCFNTVSRDGEPGPDGVFPDVTGGTTFVMATELTAAGPRTRTILVYSESANPASPFHTDQTRLYAAKQWVTERFTDKEINSDPDLTVQRLR